MKRLLTFLVLLLAVVDIYADNPVTVKAGNPVVFNEVSQALIVVDYSKTMVKDQTLDVYLKSRGEDFVRDWPQDQDKALEYFVVRFNKKNKKGMQLGKNLTDAKYKMVIYVDYMDMGNGGSTFIPFASSKAGGVIMKGRCDVIDVKAGQYVCRMDFDEVKGVGHPSETVRLGMTYFELASNIFKLAKNATGSVEYCGAIAKPKKKVVRQVVEEPVETTTASKATAKSSTRSGTTARKGAPARKGTGARRGTPVRKGTPARKPAATTAKTATAATTTAAPKQRKVKYIEVDEDGNETEIIYVKKGTKTPIVVEEEEEEEGAPEVAPTPARKTIATKGNKVPKTVLNAVSHLKLKNSVGGDAKCLKNETALSVYLDFSKCEIINNNEADFTKYMETEADKKDRESNFAEKWENSYKPSLTSIFVSNMKKELKKNRLRGTLQQGNKYTLKVALTKIDDNGNTWGDYLIVETATGNVVQHMQMRSKGGHFGDFIGLMKQGFEAAGEIYGELLADRID